MNLKNQLQENGHAILDGSRYIKLIDVETIKFGFENGLSKENIPISDSKDIDLALSIIHQEISMDFIEPYFDKFEKTRRLIWENSPKHHQLWHNDSTEKNNNMFFLLYFTDQTKHQDGAIKFKSDLGEYRYVPYPGLLIALENSNPKWLHMVEPYNSKRIVANFSFKVNWGKHDI